MTVVQFCIEQAKLNIHNLDISKIERRLVRVDGYSEGKAREAIAMYKQFLMLKAEYPDRHLVPPVAVDHALHAHILHTRQYARDMQAIFGGFLHHDPEEATGAAYEEARAFTRQAFLDHFGIGVDAFEMCWLNLEDKEKLAA